MTGSSLINRPCHLPCAGSIIFLQPMNISVANNHHSAMAKRTKEDKPKGEKSAVPLINKSKAEIDPALASLFAQSVSSNCFDKTAIG